MSEQEHQGTVAVGDPSSYPHLEGANENLIAFAKECFEEAGQGGDITGDYIQDLGVRFGLLKETKFDPAKHSDPDGFAEPGCRWYEYADELLQAPPESHSRGEPFGAVTYDLTDCEYFSRDVSLIERVAAMGSNGPTEVIYLYAGKPPEAHSVGDECKYSKDQGIPEARCAVRCVYEEKGFSAGIEQAARVAERYDDTDTLTAPKAIASAIRALRVQP